jgi:hypothetical protein
MTISSNEKQKIQKSVNDLIRGDFDDRTVDHLFMGLRAHSGNYVVFREIADYVAHNNLRDRGITNDSLEAFYLSFKYFIEYASPKKELDILRPFPLYIKKLMKYQIEKCKESDLRTKFNVTKARLKSRIDNLFKDDAKKGTTEIRQGEKINQTMFGALQHLLSFIASQPAYTQEQILEELVAVIKSNKILLDDALIYQQGDKVMLCVLLLLHNTEYDFKGHKKGYCKISCEKTGLLLGLKYLDEAGKVISINESFGMLALNGHVAVSNNGSDVTVCFPIVSTTLQAEDWCDQSLFSIGPNQPGDNSLLFRRVELDQNLSIGSNFKLSA